MSGHSHEEIAMNVVALSSSISFGVLEMLSELGRHNKNSQLQAIRTKRLHTLYELNFIYTKATFTATAIPFLNQCEISDVEPTIENLYLFVEKSENLAYQARFRAMLDLNIPCIVKRLGIRLNSEEISDGGSALFFPVAFARNMSWYRDFYNMKYLNGKFTPAEEDVLPENPDFERFLMKVYPQEANKIKTRPKIRQYSRRHPGENIKYGVYKSKYAHLTESFTKTDSHEGGDFIQENQLGRVIPFLKRGQIFSNEIFADAVRMCELSRVSQSQSKNDGHKTEVIRKRPKYENEIQATVALILFKKEDPKIKIGLGELHEDVLSIKKIGKENYRQFFQKRILAIPTGSIRLKPAFITRQAGLEYEKLENQTKKEISEKILDLMSKINFENPEEKIYFENQAVKTTMKKSKLIEIHTELTEMLILEEID